MTQAQRIENYINDFGAITPIDAFRDLGITKLATRISEMKKSGYRFSQKWIKSENRYGEPVQFMEYSWVEEDA